MLRNKRWCGAVWIAAGAAVFSLGVVSSQFHWWGAEPFHQARAAFEAQQERNQYLRGLKQQSDKSTEVPFVRARVLDTQTSYGDYTLLCKEDNAPVLVNTAGKIVHQWRAALSRYRDATPHLENPMPDAAIYCTAAHLYPNGDLLMVVHAHSDTPYGYGLMKLDKDSELLWFYPEHAHHDVYVAQNGDVYTLTQQFRTQPLPGHPYLPTPMLVDAVSVLGADGRPIQTISILEAFLGTPYEAFLPRAYAEAMTDKEKAYDVTHANSVRPLEPDVATAFPQFKPGFLLVSVKKLHALVVIDPVSRKVVWAATGSWRMQHQASYLPSGNILLFDNLGKLWSDLKEGSRMIEIELGQSRTEWAYPLDKQSAGLSSKYKGYADLLPNGNRLMVATQQGKLIEVSANGTEVSRLSTDGHLSMAQRLPAAYFTAEFCQSIGCASGSSQASHEDR